MRARARVCLYVCVCVFKVCVCGCVYERCLAATSGRPRARGSWWTILTQTLHSPPCGPGSSRQMQMIDDSPTLTFTKGSYQLETEEAERVSVDQVLGLGVWGQGIRVRA